MVSLTGVGVLLTRGVQDTSNNPGKRLFGETYFTKSKRLMALPGIELAVAGQRLAQLICPCYRVNLRTIGRLCPVEREGRIKP